MSDAAPRRVGEHPCARGDLPPPRADLEVVLDHVVGPGDTDHLGHMNIRRYAELAESAIPRIVASVGLDGPVLARLGAVAMATDAYTRHYREQFTGAPLQLRFGFLDADGAGLTVYAELRNVESGDLAATFVQWVRLLGQADRTAIDVPTAAVAVALARTVEWPEHGRPRTLSLAPIRIATPAELRDLALEPWNDGHLAATHCDARGWFVGGLTGLAWGVERELHSDLAEEERSWLHVTADGRSLGLTNVENRRVLVELPRAGARIRTVAANLVIASNRRVRREWSFDPGTGTVFATGDFVDLVFDSGTRRASEIPPGFRAELERWLHPELA